MGGLAGVGAVDWLAAGKTCRDVEGRQRLLPEPIIIDTE